LYNYFNIRSSQQSAIACTPAKKPSIFEDVGDIVSELEETAPTTPATSRMKPAAEPMTAKKISQVDTLPPPSTAKKEKRVKRL